MASGGKDNFSDEVFHFKCTTCDKMNKNREAVKYCVECKGYCCQSCVDMHSVFPTLLNHNLLDKSSFKSSALTGELPEVPTVRCGEHDVKVIDMYCGNHDVVGCTTCMSLDHRNCNDVWSIPENIEKIFREIDITKTKEEMLKASKQMLESKQARESFLLELQKSKVEALNSIKTFRKEMELFLESLEKASVKEVEKKYCQAEIVLKQEKKKAEQEIDTLRKASDDLQSTEGNRTQLFVYIKKAQKIITEAEDVSHSLQTRADVKIIFSPNISISECLQNTQTFGSIITETAPISTHTPRNTLYSVKGTREMNVKSKNDTSTCLIWGSCLVDDGILLLADYWNKKVKLADIVKMSLLDTCDLPAGPQAVCCINKQEAAVSLINNTIQFVSLGNRLTCTKKIKLNHYCKGIAYKNNRLYVTDNKKQLYIHDMSGNLLQKVSRDSAGNEMFQSCRHIAFDDDYSNLLIADSIGLVTVDLNGKHINTFQDEDLKEAFGVCTDNRGNVFVCGYSSHNVVQVAQSDCRKLGVVVKSSDGVKKPYSVCFDSSQCVLIITQHNDDTIKLFDLQ